MTDLSAISLEIANVDSMGKFITINDLQRLTRSELSCLFVKARQLFCQ